MSLNEQYQYRLFAELERSGYKLSYGELDKLELHIPISKLRYMNPNLVINTMLGSHDKDQNPTDAQRRINRDITHLSYTNIIDNSFSIPIPYDEISTMIDKMGPKLTGIMLKLTQSTISQLMMRPFNYYKVNNHCTLLDHYHLKLPYPVAFTRHLTYFISTLSDNHYVHPSLIMENIMITEMSAYVDRIINTRTSIVLKGDVISIRSKHVNVASAFMKFQIYLMTGFEYFFEYLDTIVGLLDSIIDFVNNNESIKNIVDKIYKARYDKEAPILYDEERLFSVYACEKLISKKGDVDNVMEETNDQLIFTKNSLVTTNTGTSVDGSDETMTTGAEVKLVNVKNAIDKIRIDNEWYAVYSNMFTSVNIPTLSGKISIINSIVDRDLESIYIELSGRLKTRQPVITDGGDVAIGMNYSHNWRFVNVIECNANNGCVVSDYNDHVTAIVIAGLLGEVSMIINKTNLNVDVGSVVLLSPGSFEIWCNSGYIIWYS